ncbi:hypothetical protein TYRP_019489 [Tyrophagus putrescentiae]|nr:hypothetical protein TYRP_019489 [Tyrophagus putrescentiae]
MLKCSTLAKNRLHRRLVTAAHPAVVVDPSGRDLDVSQRHQRPVPCVRRLILAAEVPGTHSAVAHSYLEVPPEEVAVGRVEVPRVYQVAHRLIGAQLPVKPLHKSDIIRQFPFFRHHPLQIILLNADSALQGDVLNYLKGNTLRVKGEGVAEGTEVVGHRLGDSQPVFRDHSLRKKVKERLTCSMQCASVDDSVGGVMPMLKHFSCVYRHFGHSFLFVTLPIAESKQTRQCLIGGPISLKILALRNLPV